MHYQNELYQSVIPIENEKSYNTRQLLVALTCAILITASYAFFSTKSQRPAPKNIVLTIPDITTTIKQAGKSKPLLTEVPPPEVEAPAQNSTHTPTLSMQSLSTIWQEHIIKSGENLSAIFSANDLAKIDLYKIIHANDISFQFTAIRPGRSLLIGRDVSGKFSHLVYRKNLYEELRATRNEDQSFSVKLNTKVIDRHIDSATGVIHSSLFIDGKNAGLSDNIIMQLASIFAWDVDVALSLQEGDKFSVIYEDLYIDKTMIGPGNILAAELISHGKSIKAVRYENAEGNTSYYTPAGHNMRKAFLRTPIDFARISSRFNLRRKHPVLNRIRAHKGVDYAASTGTPIKAAGEGRIVFRGYQNGYGNVVIIQHGQKYSTLYAHMSKFKKGLRKGAHVSQSDIIGYVGSTGLASGPHLHYEFRINGAHRNPLTVKLPDASPIQKKYKADFMATSRPLFEQLEQLSSVRVASSDIVE